MWTSAPRRLLTVVRIGLFVAMGVTAAFYALMVAQAPPPIWHYTFFDPINVRLFVYDVCAACHLVYLVVVAVRIGRLHNPFIPWAISVFHIVVLPYLVMGDGAVFLRFKRFGAFWAAYPLAMACLTLWLAAWGIRKARGR